MLGLCAVFAPVLQAKAPLYIRKTVWEACSTTLRNSSTWPTVNFIRGKDEDRRTGGSSGSSSGSSGSSSERRSRCVWAVACLCVGWWALSSWHTG